MPQRLLCFMLFVLTAIAHAAESSPRPWIDAHFHVMPYMDLAQLVQAMDRNGIIASGGAQAVGPPRRNAEVAETLGTRYIRSTGQSQWLMLKDRGGEAALEKSDSPEFAQALASIETDLRDNGARIVGEIHVSSRNSAANPRVNIKVAADGAGLRAIFDLATKYRRALNIHAEWDADSARQIVELARSNRNGRLVLSHCGVHGSPAQIREAFAQNPNLWCDLSYRSPPQLKPKILYRQIFDAQRLDDAWKQLIEEYSDRFVVGIDDVHNWDEYEATALAIRNGLLANLAPDVAEKVAQRNARILFGLE